MKATIEELRNKFFEECVSENTGGYKIINYAAHDLFEWIKENIIQPEPQKETIEEAAERVAYDSTEENKGFPSMKMFIEGAKWQQERMYSEEDMGKAYFQGWATRERYDDMVPDIIYPKDLDYEEQQDYAFNLWFEQFKKK